MRPLVALASLLLVTPAVVPAQAQSHPLVGSWAVQMPIGVRMENGGPTPVMGPGALVVAAVGDSLITTLTALPSAGQPAEPAMRLAARAVPGAVTFVNLGTATVGIGGATSERVMTTTLRLEAVGNALNGTMEQRVEGVEGLIGGAGTITGKRD